MVLPDRAKSAATLIALGADSILMGPVSDLGPIDPQFVIGDGGLVAGKAIIAAVEDAERRIQATPESYPLWASLLADVTAIKVQQARDAIARSAVLLREALSSLSARSPEVVEQLAVALTPPLIDEPTDHGAVFDADDALKCGLPVEKLDPAASHWRLVWRLWARYAGFEGAVYESAKASQILG